MNNRDKIKKILEDAKWSQLAVRASLARIQQESNFDPKAHRPNDAGPGKHSDGILQWNRERRANLHSFAASKGLDPKDVTTQALFYVEEVEGRIGSEGEYGKKLLSASTSEEAAKAAISMARPKHWTKANPELGHNYPNLLKMIRGGNLSTGPESSESDTPAPADEPKPDEKLVMDTVEPTRKPGFQDTLTGLMAAMQAGATHAKDTNRATIDNRTMLRAEMNDPVGQATISGIMSTVRRLF